MRQLLIPLLVIITFIILVFVSGAIFVVTQKQYAVVTQFGEIKKVVNQPGLFFKVPIIQKANFLEKRIITLDEREPTNIITEEKNFLLVDMYAKWKIIDPEKFYTKIRTINSAQQRITQVINAKLREEFGRRSLKDVISEQREVVMQKLLATSSNELGEFGLEIVDVRLKKVELPDAVLDSTFARMKAERLRVANELRSTGAAQSERIRAEADRESRVILAEAYSQAEITRGEGDAQAANIYAQAYEQDPEFYSFYKSMTVYQQNLGKGDDLFILDPKSKFLQHYQ